MPKPVIYMDGKYLEVSPGVLEALTPGAVCLLGVFETMRYDGKQVEFLDAHVQRMSKGLRVLNLKHSYNATRLKFIARQLVRRNPLRGTGRVRLMIFRQGKDVHCAGMVQAYHCPSKEQYRRGVRLKVVRTPRAASARYAEVKSLDYGLFARAYAQAKAEGFDDALLLNTRGEVMESSRANIFAYIKGGLMTPSVSSGCLRGIMRGQVILQARQMGLKVSEKKLTLELLKSAQGMFLTNSLMGIMPVAAIA